MAVILDTAGASIEDTAGAAVQDTAGPVPPFAAPRSAVPRHPSARRGTARGSAGAAYVYVPVIPAPFTLPRRAVKGIPARRAGTGRGSAGAPYVFIAPVAQETSGSTTGTSLTLTFGENTTPGNAVIVAVAGFYGGTVSGISLGGVGSTFTEVAASGNDDANAQVWANAGVGQSSTTIVITTSTAGILAWAYEVNASLASDVAAGTSGSGTAWSSGASGGGIPYGHFAVGIGSVVSNAGSITQTASGWTGETSITDVVGAGSHAVGAVSGYLTAPAAVSRTFTYSGTSATSSAWGAAVASFVALPHGGSADGNYSSIWGGCIFSEHASYTGITATFTIPSVTGTDSGGEVTSIWVGLGDVYQTGLYQTYDTSYAGNSWTRPWSWWLPGAGEDWNQAAFPTAAGDSVTLTMQLTAADWLMTIANNTEDWTYTEVRSVLSVNLGSIQNNGAGPAFWPYPMTQAEVIIEKETGLLVDYGSVAFTNIATVPAAGVAPLPLLTVNADIDQYPAAIVLSGGAVSFTMHYNATS
jgi:hypothetical protein